MSRAVEYVGGPNRRIRYWLLAGRWEYRVDPISDSWGSHVGYQLARFGPDGCRWWAGGLIRRRRAAEKKARADVAAGHPAVGWSAQIV